MPEIRSNHDGFLEKSSEEWVSRPVKRTKIICSDSKHPRLSRVQMPADCHLVTRTVLDGTSWFAADEDHDESTRDKSDDTYLIMESHALTFESMGRPTKMLPTSQHAQNIQALDIIQRIEAIYI